MITLKIADLKEHMPALRKVVEKKTTIPILSYVRICETDGFVHVTGTNLDHTYECWMPSEVTGFDDYVLPFHLLNSIFQTTDASDITIERGEENGMTLITSGSSSWSLDKRDVGDFPDIPKLSMAVTRITVAADRLRQAVKLAKFAISQEQSRFTLNVAKAIFDNGMTMVTTDGHRLVYFKDTIAGDGDGFDKCLPVEMMDIVLLMKTNSFQISDHGQNIVVESEKARFINRSIPVNFPNFEMVMPRPDDLPFSLAFEASQMVRICKQVLGSQTGNRQSVLRIAIDPDNETRVIAKIENSMFASDGQYSAKLDVAGLAGVSDKIDIGFNPTYIMQFCKLVGKGEVKMTFADANRQVQFETLEDRGYEYKYVVMPLRI